MSRKFVYTCIFRKFVYACIFRNFVYACILRKYVYLGNMYMLLYQPGEWYVRICDRFFM